MTQSSIGIYQEKTVKMLMRESTLKIMAAALKARIPPEPVLCQIANMATRIQTYERLVEISGPLMDRPDVRKRLREAGYKIPVRSEREY